MGSKKIVSVLLEYESLQPVSAEIGEQIHNDQQLLLNARSYWVEPLWVEFDSSPPSKLHGCHKMLMSGGYSNGSGQWVDVSEDEDWLMAWSDADFVVKQLAQWSAQHGIDWVILSYGEAIGRIVAGTPDNDICEDVASMREMTRLDPAMVAKLTGSIKAERNRPSCPKPTALGRCTRFRKSISQ